jgi:hypothetical protein
LLFFINVAKSLKTGALAGANPWDAPTLEWSVPSPPPPYNFAVIPTIASVNPLWEDRLDEQQARSSIQRGMVLDSGKESIATTSIDAVPDMILQMPEDSVAPAITALGITIAFVGLLLRALWLAAWGVVWGGAFITLIGLLMWLWPRRDLREREPARQSPPGRPVSKEAVA